MNILALCGSLRHNSVNRLLLLAAKELVLPAMSIQIDVTLPVLPLFNPDLERMLPSVVEFFFRQVDQADALVIASPEYAHGVTGAMKNALDWLVSTPYAVDKPVLVMNASGRAQHADTALREILKTMNVRLVGDKSSLVAIQGLNLSIADIVSSECFVNNIHHALGLLKQEMLLK
jgi:chromate reductase, NAD(P)H dehydrogenase (quinone)